MVLFVVELCLTELILGFELVQASGFAGFLDTQGLMGGAKVRQPHVSLINTHLQLLYLLRTTFNPPHQPRLLLTILPLLLLVTNQVIPLHNLHLLQHQIVLISLFVNLFLQLRYLLGTDPQLYLEPLLFHLQFLLGGVGCYASVIYLLLKLFVGCF